MSLHWTEEQYQAHLRRGTGQPAPMPEGVWMAAVRRIAKDAGYTFQYHVFDSRRTVYGYPDLTLVHRDPGHPLLMIELKTDTGQVTPAQAAWLTAMAGCTAWWPRLETKDLEAIVQRLQGR